MPRPEERTAIRGEIPQEAEIARSQTGNPTRGRSLGGLQGLPEGGLPPPGLRVLDGDRPPP